ncbi:MAG: nitric oxide dioxygenase, partial [Algoriella sp.]
MNFNLLTVKEIIKLTDDAVQISFDVPEELHTAYNFLPGQYITLNINGERRDYSLCTSPNDKKW